MTTRWGIIGLGKIAHTFVEDLKRVDGAELFAVASRTLSKANDFAKKHNAKYAYGSYSDLLKNPDVDIVYIATPHVFHYKNSLAAMHHAKAVLCEKPLGMNALQVKEMQAVARGHEVFFMEALWTNFMPALKYINDITTQQSYGKLNHLEAEFCFKPEFDKTHRLFDKALGGGALLDIGIYPVYLALKCLGVPDKIEAKAEFCKTGVDVETRISFTYDNGSSADLFCSLNTSTKSQAHLNYDNAEIIMHERFHETDKLSIITKEENIFKNFKHSCKGYNFEIEHVQECLQKGLQESPLMTHNFSLELIETLDRIRKEVGLEYE